MHGKAVKIRHCPATVSGISSRAHATASKSACGKAGAKLDREVRRPVQRKTWELFSEGEKIMSTLSLLFFLLLSPSEHFQGIVEDPTGAAIAGAKVQISGPSFIRETYTDSNGRFIFDEALPGDYSILITAAAFAPYSASIRLPAGTFAVTLQIAPRGEDVLVTATRVETPLSMLGVSATAFDH